MATHEWLRLHTPSQGVAVVFLQMVLAQQGLTMMKVAPETSSEVRFSDVALAIEFLSWIVVVLCLFLRLVNGAAVTRDQFGIQVALFAVSLTSAVGLRVYNYLLR